MVSSPPSAAKAGALSTDEYAQIKLVEGFRHAEGRRIDAKRETTRKGGKKAAPVSISSGQAELLKAQADPLDRLLMCLLLDHGLRVGEVASLVASDFDLARRVHAYLFKREIERIGEGHAHSDLSPLPPNALAELDPERPFRRWLSCPSDDLRDTLTRRAAARRGGLIAVVGARDGPMGLQRTLIRKYG